VIVSVTSSVDFCRCTCAGMGYVGCYAYVVLLCTA